MPGLIRSTIVGQASTLEGISEVMLSTINHYTLRTNPAYCQKVIANVALMYSERKTNLPDRIKDRIYRIETHLKG